MLSSVVYLEAHPRRSAALASRVALRDGRRFRPGRKASSFPSNPLGIHISKTPLPQPLYNAHFRRPLGCVGNKGLTGTRIHPQLFCNQHLRTLLGSVANTGVITLLESALTKNAPATPLESALTKNRGVGVLLLTTHPMRMRILSERSESKDLSSHPRKGVCPERPSGVEDLSSHPTGRLSLSPVTSHQSRVTVLPPVPLHRRSHSARMVLNAALTPHRETSPLVPVSKSSRADAGRGNSVLPIPGQVSCRQAGPGSIQQGCGIQRAGKAGSVRLGQYALVG
jgi:hypothetical protein